MRQRLPSAAYGPILAALIAVAGAAGAEDEIALPESRVTVRQISGARIVQAVLPGRSLGARPVTGAGVAVLLAPADAPGEAPAEKPKALYRFDPAGDGSLTLLARDLPPELDAVAVLDGNDRGEVIAGAPGRIYSLGTLDDPATGRAPRLLLEAPDLDLDLLRRRGLIAASRAFVPRPGLGRLDGYRWDGGGAPTPREIELPLRTRRVRSGLVLSTPPLRLLERDGQPPLIAAGPELQGKRRLLTTLIDPASPAGLEGEEGAGNEVWARFSANERIAQSWFLSVDGKPMLAVAALSADKLGIFEKKKLRLFPLRSDRTRAGSTPSLAIDTATRNWYDLGVHVADLDRDGRDDLVVVQPDGLGAKKLVVEAYRGKGGGGFFLSPRRSVVVAPEADWVYGEDLDGDRVADLVAATGDSLLIFRGLGTSKKKGVIEKTPYRSFEIGDLGDALETTVEILVGNDEAGEDDDSDSDSDWEAFRRPLVADLDGDGRGEILLHGEVGGRTVLRVIELR